MNGLPKISSILTLLFDENLCINFLREQGVFYNERTCPSCNVEMKFYESILSFRCPKKNCNKRISLKTNSFFSKCRLKCHEVMHLAYLWLSKAKNETAIIHTGFSKETISDYYKYFRELVASGVILEDNMIGGEGIIVELDESKLGKRKYHRGHHVEGVWIFGGVERTPQRDTFFVAVENRNAETLLEIIRTHVRPGSIIITDLWRAYSGIQRLLGFDHLCVNHSQYFVDPETGAHTNSIEGTWNGLKICIGPRSRVRDGIESRIGEFQWRRINSTNIWEAFLCLLKDIHYD